MMKSTCLRGVRGMLAGAVLSVMAVPGIAHAQASDPNPGALTFTGGLDAPTVYVFRGIVQESDPKLTLWPYGDIGLALKSGDGAIKSVGVNFGVWNSLHTGSSGSDGFSEHLHYEEDFYTTLSFGFAKGISFGTTYTAYTSPNMMFNTVKEISLKVAQTGRFNPYGLVGFEVGSNGADGGHHKGTYVELGAAPAFPLPAGKLTLTVPVKVGLSGKDYYENPITGEDSRFGFFDVGGVLTLPLSAIPASYGAWNIHGSVDVLMFGDTTKAINNGDGNKVVALVGVGVTY